MSNMFCLFQDQQSEVLREKTEPGFNYFSNSFIVFYYLGLICVLQDLLIKQQTEHAALAAVRAVKK